MLISVISTLCLEKIKINYIVKAIKCRSGLTRRNGQNNSPARSQPVTDAGRFSHKISHTLRHIWKFTDYPNLHKLYVCLLREGVCLGCPSEAPPRRASSHSRRVIAQYHSV